MIDPLVVLSFPPFILSCTFCFSIRTDVGIARTTDEFYFSKFHFVLCFPVSKKAKLKGNRSMMQQNSWIESENRKNGRLNERRKRTTWLCVPIKQQDVHLVCSSSKVQMEIVSQREKTKHFVLYCPLFSFQLFLINITHFISFSIFLYQLKWSGFLRPRSR